MLHLANRPAQSKHPPLAAESYRRPVMSLGDVTPTRIVHLRHDSGLEPQCRIQELLSKLQLHLLLPRAFTPNRRRAGLDSTSLTGLTQLVNVIPRRQTLTLTH